MRILDPPPAPVKAVLASLTAALDRPVGGGGVPAKDAANMLIATWNIRELGGFTDKWVSGPGDSPTRDVRSLLFIATMLERFDLIAIQELQENASALQQILTWLNRDFPARWRIVVSDVTRGDAGGGERLGYLFDSSRIDLDGLVGEIVLDNEEVHISEGRIVRQFARTPYAVSFRPVTGTRNAFIVITLHVNWGEPVLRQFEVRRIAEWIRDWANEPHVWDPDIITLGDFNIDRSDNPAYAPFFDILTRPAEMDTFPRTIFAAGKNKHYDQIAWFDDPPALNFSLRYQDCGYFDFDTLLRPAYNLPATSFSFRISDHYPMCARFNTT